MKYILIALALVLSFSVLAEQDRYNFDNKKQAVLFGELTKELRCPKCQNQNIADSNAVVAKDLRDKVLALVKAGKSKDEVLDYMIDRYGYFVHYDPPVTPSTLVLWVFPILIVVFGFGFIIIRQRKAAIKQTWTEHDEALLNKLIAQNQRQEHH